MPRSNHFVAESVRLDWGAPLEMDVEIFERVIRDEAGAVEYHYVLVDYRCTVVGGELLAADDACAVAWIERGRLAEYRITEGTVPVIEKAFARR